MPGFLNSILFNGIIKKDWSLRLILILLIWACFTSGFAQGDTIYIDEPPVVVKKKVFVEEKLPKIPNRKQIYYSIQTGVSINRDYYSPCTTPYCYDYYLQMRRASKPLYNNIVSVAAGFISGRFALESVLYYSLYRESFNYIDKNRTPFETKSYYHSIDLSVLPGYLIESKKKRKRKQYYISINSGLSLSWLANVKGLMYSKEVFSEVSDINKELKFNPLIGRFETALSIGRKQLKTFNLKTTLFYSYDLRSIINRTDFFTRQRNVLGLKVGICYFNRSFQ